ncbi:RcnB family protein [Cobetia sp.]|jgi:Ni/Co efflux regulator RcnB|uniref:RcnB family protein n=1 Tax=Cobetia sp. TaxID=1873876 RepID=UPI00257BAFE2|nr:RcnB family protein [Cobetia sp.]|tara:strand:+ start:5800 stop:6276 length:477 start_codon:yes stop_codon:yes gene_type:complete
MNKGALRGLTLALAVLGASGVQAAEDGKDSDDHLKKKHEALEGQAKAQRVQAEQMRDLKQIQKQQQAQEAQEQQEAQEKHKGPQAERSDASSAERGPLLRRGDQLPDAMASDESLRVKDWQQSRLPEPGEGQRWIQLKSGYVLTDIQSGVIEEILLGP